MGRLSTTDCTYLPTYLALMGFTYLPSSLGARLGIGARYRTGQRIPSTFSADCCATNYELFANSWGRGGAIGCRPGNLRGRGWWSRRLWAVVAQWPLGATFLREKTGVCSVHSLGRRVDEKQGVESNGPSGP